LEFISAILSPNDTKIMIVNATKGRLEFVLPQDALQLPPGKGKFSCCARRHIDNYGNEIDCDKQKIRTVLDKMLKSSQAQLEMDKKFFKMRYLICLQHFFYRGCDDQPGEDEDSGGDDDETVTIEDLNSSRRQSTQILIGDIVSKYNLATEVSAVKMDEKEAGGGRGDHEQHEKISSRRSTQGMSFISFAKEKQMADMLINGDTTVNKLLDGDFVMKDCDR